MVIVIREFEDGSFELVPIHEGATRETAAWGCELEEYRDLLTELEQFRVESLRFNLLGKWGLAYLKNMWRVVDMTMLVRALKQ